MHQYINYLKSHKNQIVDIYVKEIPKQFVKNYNEWYWFSDDIQINILSDEYDKYKIYAYMVLNGKVNTDYGFLVYIA